MTFVPESSFVPATVIVGGSVSVSNFPASQPVTGPLTAAELLALEPLSVTGAVAVSGNVGIIGTPNVGAIQITSPWQVQGGLTDAELRAAPVDVLGPLTDAELRASDVGVSGPLTDAELRATPLDVPDGAATEDTLSEIALTAILQREALEVT